LHLSSAASEPRSGQICVTCTVADRGRSDVHAGTIKFDMSTFPKFGRAADVPKATPSPDRRHREPIATLTLRSVQNSTGRWALLLFYSLQASSNCCGKRPIEEAIFACFAKSRIILECFKYGAFLCCQNRSELRLHWAHRFRSKTVLSILKTPWIAPVRPRWI
jgi:hypothetical protein